MFKSSICTVLPPRPSWLFDDDSNFSGPDSVGGEGEDVYAYRGPTLIASTLREEETMENIFSGKCFYSESALYL